MEFIENISKSEYEQFVSTHSIKGHFLQSYYWGNVSKKKNYTPHYVGLKDNKKLVATALLLQKHVIGKYSFFYCPRGFVCDYNNIEVVKNFTTHLKKYCKKKKGIFLRIDPDIKLQNLDIEGNIIDGLDNHKLVDELIGLGYKHKGFNKNFENNEPRYTFRLDVGRGIEEVRKNLHPTTRNIINRGNIFNIKVYRGNIDNVKDFYDTMQDTAKREKLTIPSLEYYESFYSILNKEKMSDIYIAKINLNDLKKVYETKIDTIKQSIELANVKDEQKNKDKINSKVNDLNQQLDKWKKEYDEVKKIKEKEIVLSSMITAKYQNKVWTVHGGNSDELRFLNANYWLYYTIIEDAVKDGYKIVDFFGTTGEPTPGNSVYGIHLFKKRLGGEYTEFIGEFDYVLNPLLYFAYTKVYPKIRRKLKRKKIS